MSAGIASVNIPTRGSNRMYFMDFTPYNITVVGISSFMTASSGFAPEMVASAIFIKKKPLLPDTQRVRTGSSISVDYEYFNFLTN